MRLRTRGAMEHFGEVARRGGQDRLARYGAALGVTSVAMLATLAIDQWNEEASSPFPLLLAAVMISSWYGGLGPGLLSIAIGLPIISFMFIDPVNSLAVATLVGIERLVVFLFVALLISWLNTRRQQTEDRLMIHASRQRALIELGYALAGTNLDLHAILQTAAMRTTEVIGDGCIIRLVGTDGETPKPVAYHHVDPQGLARLRDLLAESPSAFDGAIARHVIQSRGVLGGAVTDAVVPLEIPSALPNGPGLASLTAPCFLMVPLLNRKRCLGSLMIWRQGERYSTADEHFLQELAMCIALAVDNGRLYGEAREAEARYRGLFDNSADAILVSDTGGRVLDVNQAATRLLDGRNGHGGLLSIGELVEGDWPLPWSSAEREPCASDWRGELDVRRSDGSRVPVEASVTTVSLPKRTVTLSTLRDISERRQLEQAQRDFISSVSHDLRTPLTAIRTGVVLLLQNAAGRLQPAECDLLQHAQLNSERLGGLIDDLLALNLLETGTHPLDPEPLDLRTSVTAAVSAVYAPMRNKQQTLELDLPTPLPVHGDQARLEQVICNLLDNAHLHTPPGTRIVVTGRTSAKEIHLTVADDGPGIPETMLETIFERFQRLNPSSSGSGLGLVIARRLVDAHGGQLWAETAPGGGAAFQLMLPRCEERSAP